MPFSLEFDKNFWRRVHFFGSMITSTTRTLSRSQLRTYGGYSGARPSFPVISLVLLTTRYLVQVFTNFCGFVEKYVRTASSFRRKSHTITAPLGPGTDVKTETDRIDGAALFDVFDPNNTATRAKITVFGNEVAVAASATSEMAFYTVRLDRNPSADHNRPVSAI